MASWKEQTFPSAPSFRQGKNGLFVGDVRKASLLAQLLPQPENGPLKFVDISMPIGEGD